MRLVRVSLKINEENIVPFSPVRRPRLDTGHADPVPCQRLEQPRQGPRCIRVARRSQERSAILAARGEEFTPEHQKSGRVIAAILDLGRQPLEPVDLCGGLARDCGSSLLVPRTALSLFITLYGHLLDIG